LETTQDGFTKHLSSNSWENKS